MKTGYPDCRTITSASVLFRKLKPSSVLVLIMSWTDRSYFDDRIVLLHKTRCLVDELHDGRIRTNVFFKYHKWSYQWCIVVLWNCPEYPILAVRHVKNRKEADLYMKIVEPTTPLVSQEGRRSDFSHSYESFQKWKKKNKFVNFGYEQKFFVEPEDPQEYFIQENDVYFSGLDAVEKILALKQ